MVFHLPSATPKTTDTEPSASKNPATKWSKVFESSVTHLGSFPGFSRRKENDLSTTTAACQLNSLVVRLNPGMRFTWPYFSKVFLKSSSIAGWEVVVVMRIPLWSLVTWRSPTLSPRVYALSRLLPSNGCLGCLSSPRLFIPALFSRAQTVVLAIPISAAILRVDSPRDSYNSFKSSAGTGLSFFERPFLDISA